MAYANFAIGPIEEFSKCLPFVLIVLRFKALDEPIDGIIYASFIGLGYAAIENVQYLRLTDTTGGSGAWLRGPFRAYRIRVNLGALDRGSSSYRTLATLAALTVAALLHGNYDFIVLLSPDVSLPVAALIIVSIWLWRLRLLRDLHRKATLSEQMDTDPDE